MAEYVDDPGTVRMTRAISAGPAEVYRAFLDEGLLARWYGPGDFEVLSVEVDPRVGGRHRVSVRGPQDVVGTFEGEIRELVPAERIVMTWRWVSTNGNGSDGRNSLLTIELRPVDSGGTDLALIHSGLDRTDVGDTADERGSWVEALNKLAGTVGR